MTILKKYLLKCGVLHKIFILISSVFFLAENPDSVLQGYFSSFEEQWFRYCDEELEKINTFFAGRYLLYSIL